MIRRPRDLSTLDLASLCVTWQMRDAAGCTVPGQHIVDDEDHTDCTGCRPAPRREGALCSACWTRLEHVLADWETWTAALAGEARAFTPESSGRSKPGPRMPLSRMQVDVAVVRTHDTRGARPARVWITTDLAAMDAVRFTRAAASTMRAHPTAEHARQLGRARCPLCKTRSLLYMPPAVLGSDAIVKCGICGYTIDGERFERLAAIEEQCCRKCKSAEGCRDGSCRCHVTAPVPAWQQTSKPTEVITLDPTNPAHRHLYAEFFEDLA